MIDIITIDDTSSPGSKTESRFVKSSRKTWVAVLIDADIREELEKNLKEVLNILEVHLGIKELHFTDLINKKGEYSNLDNEEVVELLDLICELLWKYDLPYFIQTATPNTLSEIGVNIIGETKIIDDFDLSKPEDLALTLLFQRIKIYLKKMNKSPVEIIIDEGRKKAGSKHNSDFLKGFVKDDLIKYESSGDNVLLQVADFYAYGVNRLQMTLIKKDITDFDYVIADLFSEILANNLISGGEVIKVELDKFSKDDYDYHQRSKRQIDGNLNKWINANQ